MKFMMRLKSWLMPERYGHPGDSRSEDMLERRELQARLINETARKADNDLRIARIEGMVRVILLTEAGKMESSQ